MLPSSMRVQGRGHRQTIGGQFTWQKNAPSVEVAPISGSAPYSGADRGSFERITNGCYNDDRRGHQTFVPRWSQRLPTPRKRFSQPKTPLAANSAQNRHPWSRAESRSTSRCSRYRRGPALQRQRNLSNEVLFFTSLRRSVRGNEITQTTYLPRIASLGASELQKATRKLQKRNIKFSLFR
jgi:hypothetical protein